MKYIGEWRKMRVELDDNNTVNYQMVFHDSIHQKEQLLPLNSIIGKEISIQFNNTIYCKHCGKITKTSFQGFCFSCFKEAPEAAECIIRPELCRAHLGEGRDVKWEEEHHNQPHIVYLAANDVVKVGVTSVSQIPTRWIDQGAYKALVLARTPNRCLAGVIEVALKQQFSDKTNWRKMLKNEIDETIDLNEVKWELEELLPDDIAQYISDDDDELFIEYPVEQFPIKIKSINLDKTPLLSGKLVGIKGQYLILDNQRVLNVRRHEGYSVSFSTP